MASRGVVKAPSAQPEQLGFEGFFLPSAAFDPQRGPISVFPGLRLPRARPGQSAAAAAIHTTRPGNSWRSGAGSPFSHPAQSFTVAGTET